MYVVDYSSDEPIMLIDKWIGFDPDEGMGIQGDLFQRELLELDQAGKKRIQVWINSPGGIVTDGMNIYNAILATKTKVDTRCIGMAASIAGVIFQAGRTREINDYGFLMYHDPSGGDDDESLVMMRDSIVKMIAARSGMSTDAVAKMMKEETFLNAAEAVNLKLADAIIASGEVNIKRKSPAASNARAYWKEAVKITNNLFNSTSMNLSKITNKLSLNEAASEDNIISAITEIQNRATKAEKDKKDLEDKIDKLRKDLEDKKAEHDKVKDELEKCKNDLEEMDKKAKAEEDKAKKEKAKNLIEGYRAVGKIKADAVNKWIEKDLLDSIPGNAKAVRIETVDTGTQTGKSVYDKEITGGVSFDMMKISNRLEKRNN
jgi:ATP-dependent Clp endopeptidase proteolytic subunit ClpP